MAVRYVLPLLLLAVPARAEQKTDIVFATVGGTPLTLDAFVPEGAGPFPTCILVHGGGFTKGDKTAFIKPLFEPLSKAGFTWFSINYRLAPQHRFPACVEDVETAIRWVKAHAAECWWHGCARHWRRNVERRCIRSFGEQPRRTQ
jgi:acetyl esterase